MSQLFARPIDPQINHEARINHAKSKITALVSE